MSQASDTWPRRGMTPSATFPIYTVHPPTPGHGLTTPRARKTSSQRGSNGVTPPISPHVGMSPHHSGYSTPRHHFPSQHGHGRMSTSSSYRTLRHETSNSSLKASLRRSGSHSSLSAQHTHSHHVATARTRHGVSPVAETSEAPNPDDDTPLSPPRSRLPSSSSADVDVDGDAASGFSHFSDDLHSDSEGLDPDYDENMPHEHFDLPCEYYGCTSCDAETLYATSVNCACCYPQQPTGTDQDLVLAPLYPPHHSADYNTPSDTYSPPPSSGLTLTGLAHRAFFTYVVPYLPVDVQAVLRDPPDLSRPATLVPLLKAVAPYTQFVIVLLAVYVVWMFIAGMIGYAARFVRFCFRIGPVIALIAWIMAASGQGGIDVLFEALKQYAGLDSGNAQPQRAGAGAGRRAQHQAPGGYGYGGPHANPRARTHRQTRARAQQQQQQQAQPDILSAIFGNPATGQDGLAGTVQDYVRQAVTRGLGLEWLLGSNTPSDNDDPKRRKTRSR